MSVTPEARRGTAYVAALRQKMPSAVLEELLADRGTGDHHDHARSAARSGGDALLRPNGWMSSWSAATSAPERTFALYYVLSMEGAEKS